MLARVPSLAANFEITAKFEEVTHSTYKVIFMLTLAKQVSFTYIVMSNKATARENNRNNSSSNGLQLAYFGIVLRWWNTFT